MASNNINDRCWQDITDEFKRCVQELDLGELLKTDHFTLLEAMSSIELMDPKVDSGMVLKQANRKILNLEQSIRADLVKIKDLTLDELIGIIDDSYSHLTTWLGGHCLAHTVMTNLYLHEPERIEDKCLRVFSQSMLKLVEFINKLVQMVLCVEEEDYQLAGLKNPIEVNEHKLMSSLDDLCKHYQTLMEEYDANNSRKTLDSTKNSTGTETNHRLDQNGDENTRLKLTAILDRLKFTYHFYGFFLGISRNLLKDTWDLNNQSEPQLQKTIKLVQNAVINCDPHLEKCLTYLDNWIETIDLGIKVTNPETKQKDNDGDYPTIMGFEPLINYRYLPLAYQRCPMINSRPSSVEHLRNLVLKLRKCITLIGVFNQKSFRKSLESIEHFSKYFRPESCVISRSFMLALYLPSRSNKLLKDELLQSMLEYCEPVITIMKKDEALSGDLERFLIVSAQSFSQFVTIYGHNTARQHEKLAELILEFKNLQYSTFLFNDSYKHNVVQSWITYHFARFCIHYVLSGLELELFSPHEYPYVFWYLYDVLYRSERDQLEIARKLIYDSQMVSTDDNKKHSRNELKKQRRKNQTLTSFHDKNLRLNDAHRFLTGGIFLITYGLKMHGKIKTPDLGFTSEEICFEHRFGSITGGPVFHSYMQTISRLVKLEHIYREALECFLEAKTLFENIGQQEACLKVCKINIIVARILSTNLNSFADRQVEFGYDVHPSFPTIKF